MTRQEHGGDPAELAALYCAGALPESERSAFETHLGQCPQCAQHVRDLEPAVQDLLDSAAPIEPPARVRAALLARIAAPAGEPRAAALPREALQRAGGQEAPQGAGYELRTPGGQPPSQQAGHGSPQVWKAWRSDSAAGLFIRRAGEGEWEDTGVQGVRVRRLFVDRERNQFTALVRMSPGAAYPKHLHDGPEECLVLEGELRVGDHVLHAGDYQRAEEGSVHVVQSTDTGCLLLIVSSLSDELL